MKGAFVTLLTLFLAIPCQASELSIQAAEKQIQNMARSGDGPLSPQQISDFKEILKQSKLMSAPRLDHRTIVALGELTFRADEDKDFQEDVLTNEIQIFQRIGMDVDAWGYANLVDRVDVKSGRMPTYGTTWRAKDAPPSADRIREINSARQYIGIRQPFQKTVTTAVSAGRRSLAMAHPQYPTLPDVRAELIDLYVLDQEVRDFDDSKLDETERKAAHDRMKDADAKILERFRPLFDKYGIPGNRSVGRFGTLAAWTLVQHSISAPDVMRKAVRDAGKLRASGELAAGPYALLVDRVACVIDHKPQTYGTFPIGDASSQWYCPIKDVAKLGERRASVLMEPLQTKLQ
jgi:hypothetical protein